MKTKGYSVLKKGAGIEAKQLRIGVLRYLVKHGKYSNFTSGPDRVTFSKFVLIADTHLFLVTLVLCTRLNTLGSWERLGLAHHI